MAKVPLSGASGKHEVILATGTAANIGLGDGRGGAVRCSQRIAMPPTLSTTLLEGIQSLAERQWPPRILILRNCWSWGQRSPASSRGQPRVQERRM